jgi:WD40 repeat protein
MGVSFSPEGRWIVSGPEDRTLKIWDTCEYAAEPPRGTIPVSYPRRVIFSQELTLDIQKLPQWQPFLTIDRRSEEADDE